MFFFCRYTSGRLSADLPGVHVHQWFMSGSAGTISLNTGTVFQRLTHRNPPLWLPQTDIAVLYKNMPVLLTQSCSTCISLAAYPWINIPHTLPFFHASLYTAFWSQQTYLALHLCWSLNWIPTYCTKRYRGKEDRKEALERKRKVLHLVSQWMALCKDFLREDEHVKLFMKVRNIMFREKGGNSGVSRS